jgi:hypothetical protein
MQNNEIDDEASFCIFSKWEDLDNLNTPWYSHANARTGTSSRHKLTGVAKVRSKGKSKGLYRAK